jgi:hypothetical protein
MITLSAMDTQNFEDLFDMKSVIVIDFRNNWIV